MGYHLQPRGQPRSKDECQCRSQQQPGNNGVERMLRREQKQQRSSRTAESADQKHRLERNTRKTLKIVAISPGACENPREQRNRAGCIGNDGWNTREDQRWKREEGSAAGNGVYQSGNKSSDNQEKVRCHFFSLVG